MSDEVLELLTDLEEVITQENGILGEYPYDGLATVVDTKAIHLSLGATLWE